MANVNQLELSRNIKSPTLVFFFLTIFSAPACNLVMTPAFNEKFSVAKTNDVVDTLMTSFVAKLTPLHRIEFAEYFFFFFKLTPNQSL